MGVSRNLILTVMVLLSGCGFYTPPWPRDVLSPHLISSNQTERDALITAAKTWNDAAGWNVITVDGPDSLPVEPVAFLGKQGHRDVFGLWDGDSLRFLSSLADDDRLVGVLTHELGHALGLWDNGSHNPNPMSVMNADANGQTQPDALDIYQLKRIRPTH